MKITVFSMSNRLSVKFEVGQLEQTYKFQRRNGLESLADVQTLVDTVFLKEVETQFVRMQKSRFSAINRNLPQQQSEEFDEII